MQIGKQLVKLVSIAAVLLLINGPAAALSLGKYDFEAIFASADAALIVRVVDKQEGTCGFRYTGDVEFTLKGGDWLRSPTVSFGPYRGLEAGGRYLIFLQHKTGFTERFHGEFPEECTDALPTLTFSHWVHPWFELHDNNRLVIDPGKMKHLTLPNGRFNYNTYLKHLPYLDPPKPAR